MQVSHVSTAYTFWGDWFLSGCTSVRIYGTGTRACV